MKQVEAKDMTQEGNCDQHREPKIPLRLSPVENEARFRGTHRLFGEVASTTEYPFSRQRFITSTTDPCGARRSAWITMDRSAPRSCSRRRASSPSWIC